MDIFFFSFFFFIGLYTQKENIVFGKGRSGNLDTWLMLGHTVDSRLRRNRCVELRVCLQSWDAYGPTHISLDKNRFQLNCLSEVSKVKTALPVQNVRLLSKNDVRDKDKLSKCVISNYYDVQGSSSEMLSLDVLETCILGII